MLRPQAWTYLVGSVLAACASEAELARDAGVEGGDDPCLLVPPGPCCITGEEVMGSPCCPSQEGQTTRAEGPPCPRIDLKCTQGVWSATNFPPDAACEANDGRHDDVGDVGPADSTDVDERGPPLDSPADAVSDRTSG